MKVDVCPFCGSSDIEEVKHSPQSDLLLCNECQKEWSENLDENEGYENEN